MLVSCFQMHLKARHWELIVAGCYNIKLNHSIVYTSHIFYYKQLAHKLYYYKCRFVSLIADCYVLSPASDNYNVLNIVRQTNTVLSCNVTDTVRFSVDVVTIH
jgi:hypothetical protein